MNAPPSGDRPVAYADFRRSVSAYKPEALLRRLAAYSAWDFEHQSGRRQPSDPLHPWAVSMLAREALLAPGRATKRSPRRLVPDDRDLRRLGSMAIALEDPLLTETSAPRAAESYFIRTAFQQFAYQDPVVNDISRMRPMFDRAFPPDRFTVLSESSLREVLGASLDVFIDSGTLLAAVAMKRQGLFDPHSLEGPEFEEVRNRIDIASLRNTFYTAWAAPLGDLRAEAIRTQSEDPRLRQHDWNPLVGRPFVKLSDGQYAAPQYWYAAWKVRPSAVYYLGLDRYDGWAEDLGRAHEDYIRLQLRQLEPQSPVHGEYKYETRDGSALTVDAIIVLDEAVVLIEAKSLKARLDSRQTFEAYTRHLRRDLNTAFKQLDRTARMIRGHHEVLSDIPDDRRMCGVVVTPEPLWLANNAEFTAGLPDPEIDAAVVSLRELEDLVAYTIDDRRGTLWLDATKPDSQGNRSPHAALYRYQHQQNKPPRNPLLAEALAADRWGVLEEERRPVARAGGSPGGGDGRLGQHETFDRRRQGFPRILAGPKVPYEPASR